MEKLFGTDGIRGTANTHPMTAEMALFLGRALAHVFKVGKKRHRILIGKDTRLSGYMLEQALASGVCSMGCDVLLVGPLPTPAISHLTHSMRADAGVMITASHNPFQDNGLKFFGPDGFKLADEKQDQIEALYTENHLESLRSTASQIGKAFRIKDASGRYISYVKSIFPFGLTLEGLTLVLDCAHGAAYSVAPAILEELGAKVIRMGVEPDGTNINGDCGALHPQNMQALVKQKKADLGIALDGDGDRLALCDHEGNLIHGDALLSLIAQDMMEQGTLAKNTLVATIMSSLAVDHLVQSWGGSVQRVDVGDRNVVESMRTNGFNFGGEQSGHLVFLDHSKTGDGMIAALKVLAVMQARQKPLAELASIFKPYPQILLNVRVRHKKDFNSIPDIKATIDRIESALAGQGRLLLRYSGTESLARVMIEGKQHEMIQGFAKELACCLEKNLN